MRQVQIHVEAERFGTPAGVKGACVYGQVIKRWRRDRVTVVDRRLVIGTDERLADMAFVSTSVTGRMASVAHLSRRRSLLSLTQFVNYLLLVREPSLRVLREY